MGGGTSILVVLAVLVSLLGLLALSQATTGVGLIAASCLLAIFARISQANHHHRKLISMLEKSEPTKVQPSPEEFLSGRKG